MARKNEKVMCVPESVLDGVDFSEGIVLDVDALVDKVFNCGRVEFLPRNKVETDPTFKQIIPYIIIESKGRIMSYVRGKAGGEDRLHHRRSIGIGGHINDTDYAQAMYNDPVYIYSSGLLRELTEEVIIRSGMVNGFSPEPELALPPLAALYYDYDAVGAVHLGFVHWISLEGTRVESRSDSIRNICFTSMQYLYEETDVLETWSRLCMSKILDLAVKGKK